jgi:hypothetical protein
MRHLFLRVVASLVLIVVGLLSLAYFLELMVARSGAQSDVFGIGLAAVGALLGGHP